LKDKKTKIRLSRRLEKVSRGLLGDVRAVGEDVFEMREHFGPGWRMYYAQVGDEIIVMLGGGDKSTQSNDIYTAPKIAKQLKEQRWR
jgi:probable addiction module killer protein